MKKTILVLFGGESTEYEVSLISAYNVIMGADKDKYDIISVGITKDGRWYLFEGDPAKIKDGSWVNEDNKQAFISPSKNHGGIIVIDGNGFSTIKKIDICFPVLHGRNGEDGTVQGLLELSGIKYVGCGTLSSAMCMDKIIAKIVFEKYGIPYTPYMYITKEEYTNGNTKLMSKAEELGFPLFVKPANAGSSIGASKAGDSGQLIKAVEQALIYDKRVLIEKCINCREIEVAVIGTEKVSVAGPGEIISDCEFYDYDTKYITNDGVGYGIPADISDKQTMQIREYAERAYKALCCRSLARVDFFIDRDSGEIYLNEINTLPGFTDISMYPKLFVSEGVSYTSLIDLLLETSID